MHKVVVSRQHGEYEIKTEVRVSRDGSPSISMDLDDFKTAVVAEMGAVWYVMTQAQAERRMGDAFKRIVQRMKQDTQHPIATHIR